jgi:hypothetical protein
MTALAAAQDFWRAVEVCRESENNLVPVHSGISIRRL